MRSLAWGHGCQLCAVYSVVVAITVFAMWVLQSLSLCCVWCCGRCFCTTCGVRVGVIAPRVCQGWGCCAACVLGLGLLCCMCVGVGVVAPCVCRGWGYCAMCGSQSRLSCPVWCHCLCAVWMLWLLFLHHMWCHGRGWCTTWVSQSWLPSLCH